LYLQKRDINKDVQPGKWDTSVGGHVDTGEYYRDAAVRELEEELGIKGVDLKYLYKYRLRNDYESEYISSYHCLWDGEIKINVDEIEEGRFWRLDEIAEKIDSGIFTPNFIDEIGRYQKL
jgi:isopentenyldiphosphate isomerase